MLIIGNGKLITRDINKPYIEDGCVAMENGQIVEVGNTSTIRAKYKGVEYIDAKGNVIMPGLINTHHHIYSAFARGMALDNPPARNFVDILENLWWRLDKKLTLEDVKYSAYTTLIDCIKSGVTTVFDHHASPMAIKDSLFTIGDVSKELGIRSCLCYETSDRDGGNTIKQGIKENIDFIKYTKKDNDNMLRGMFGMHASFTLSDKTLEESAKSMEGLNAGYHIHAAEGIEDVHHSLKNHGKRIIERLMDYDLLGEKTLAVHCIHINSAEMDILKETKTNVVNNPESNMGNAVGCAPVIELMKRGIKVGLGTDGYTSDMFESMKVANIIHKHNLCDSNVAWGEVPQMLFENNKDIASKYFDAEIGTIKEGAKADVIIVEYNPLTPMTESNFNSHILFGMVGKSVLTTIINGNVVMKDRVLVKMDEEEIFTKSREISKMLWERV